MVNALKDVVILLIVLPMLFMIIVAIFSAILVFSDLPLPKRNRKT